MKRASSNPLRTLFASIGLLIWMAIIVTAYFSVNKPFTPPFAQALAGVAVDLATMLMFVVIAGGLGRWILGRFHLPDWSPIEHVAAAGLIGLATLAPLVLVVGSVALSAPSMLMLLALLVVITRSHLRGWLCDAASWLCRPLQVGPSAWQWFLTGAIVFMILLALLLAVLPPVKWDALTYHLAGAEDYVRHGRFYANLHNHFLGFPQGVDALYAAQLALTGRLAGSALLHWATGVLTALMVGGFAGRRFGTSAGLVAVITLLAGKSIWLELTVAYADLLAMGLAMVGLAVIDQQRLHQPDHCEPTAYRSTHRPRAILGVPLAELLPSLLLGAIAGLAMGTKYTVLWLGIAFGLMTLWISWQRPWRSRCLAATAYGLAAFLALSPWLVRNWVWYGSPIYPLVFEAAEMDAIRLAWYQRSDTGLLFTEHAWQLPVLPIAATILGVEGGSGFAHDIGPLYLVLAPIAALSWSTLTRSERKALLPVAAFVGVITVIWIVSTGLISQWNQQTRLVFYIFPPLAVLAGAGLESLQRWPNKPMNLGFVFRSMVALVISLTIMSYLQTVNRSGFTQYFSGRSDYQEEYLYRGLGWYYEAIRQVNGLPQGSTVRFLWEPRYLYCDGEVVSCRSDSLMDGWYHARRTTGDGSLAQIAQQWQAEGIDYILVYEFGRIWEMEQNSSYDAEDWEAWESFVREQLETVWSGQLDADDVQYILYQWRE